jgi:hypothetical protein
MTAPGEDPQVSEITSNEERWSELGVCKRRALWYAIKGLRDAGWTYRDFEGRERVYRAAIVWPRLLNVEELDGRDEEEVDFDDASRAGELLDVVELVEDISIESITASADVFEVWHRHGRPSRAHFQRVIEELRDRGIIDIEGCRLGMVPIAVRSFAVAKAPGSSRRGMLLVKRFDRRAASALIDLSKTVALASRSD